MPTTSSNDPADPPPPGDRREFLKTTACCILGGICVIPPVIASVVVVTAPLRKAGAGGVKVALATLDALPEGGEPRLFEVVVERTDAWTRHDRSAVGSVFLQRTGPREVRAFNASCPHLGCAVEWRAEKTEYFCPCHESSFTKEGTVNHPSPAARGLDALPVEISEAGEIAVVFQNFKAGVSAKIPVA